MTNNRMIELLEIEHECMLRGSHDDCDRKCADCELVQDDMELHEMYTNVISLLKEQEPKKAKKVVEKYGWLFGDCPSCGSRLNNKDYPKACGKCGQAVEWND